MEESSFYFSLFYFLRQYIHIVKDSQTCRRLYYSENFLLPISCTLRKCFQTFEFFFSRSFISSFCICISSLYFSFISFTKFEYFNLKYFLIDFLCLLVTLCCSMCVVSHLLFSFSSHTLDYILHWFLFDISFWNEPEFSRLWEWVQGFVSRSHIFLYYKDLIVVMFSHFKNMTYTRYIVKHISKV